MADEIKDAHAYIGCGVLVTFAVIVGVVLGLHSETPRPVAAAPPVPPMPAVGQRGILRATPGRIVPLASDPNYLVPIGSDGAFITLDLFRKYSDYVQFVSDQTPVQVVEQHPDFPRCVEVKVAAGDHCGALGYVKSEWVH